MVRVGQYAGLAIAPENPLLTLELKSPARVKKTRKVVIAVTSGKATRSFTVKLGKAAGGVLR